MQPDIEHVIRECERQLPGGLSIRRHVGGRELTTFGVGGAAQSLIEIQRLDAARLLLRRLTESGIRFRLLGAGSNLVFPDAGLDEPVLRLSRSLAEFHFVPADAVSAGDLESIASRPGADVPSGERVLAFGGCPLMGLSRKLSQAGLSGLEFAAGIPGTVGGGVRMNAGAHGHSMEEIVERVFFLTPDGTLQTLSRSELRYSYRRTSVPAGALVVASELRLRTDDPEAVLRKRQNCLEYRKKTQPLQFPSAGSVFRNPDGATAAGTPPDGPASAAAGALLEQAGMKGKRRNGVMFSELHANWLIRVEDHALAADVETLMREGQEAVLTRFGISLEPEIVFW